MATTPDSPPPSLKRDPAVYAFAALAAVLALPSTGLVRLPFLPVDPAAYGTLLTAVTAILLLAVAPARSARGLRVPTWLLALAPFFVYAWLEGGGARVPPLGWIAVVVLAWGLTWAPRRAAVAAAVIVVLGGGVVLADGGIDILPQGWNPVTDARAEPPPPPPEDAHADSTRAGPRRGAPVALEPRALPALGEGPGPWWVRATTETFPGPRPVVLVLDGRTTPPASAADVGGSGLTTVHASQVTFAGAFDLLAYDALLVRERAWSEDDPAARSRARAVADFVRKGGLLIGPGPDHAWPPHLARALRLAARGQTPGARGALRLGAGRVVRAASHVHVQEALDERLWVPDVGIALTARAEPPAWLEGLERHRERPASRRTQGILLLAYVLVLAAFTRLLRAGGAQTLGVLLASAAVGAGLAWTSPVEPGFRAYGLSIDVGGPGGRRVDAVLLDAGSRGFSGHVRWSGGGVLGLRGGARLAADGRVHVVPGRSAWVLRERDGQGPLPEETEDVAAALLRPLLLGDVDPRRLRFGRLARLPVRVEGAGPIPALTVAYRGARE